MSNTLSNTNKDNVEQSSSASFSQQCKEIVEYLNQQAGTSFQTRSKSTQTLIIARLKEGFTVENFKVVIYKKCLEWKNDPKFSQYLRPATLFAASKFEGYLNQKEKQRTLNDIETPEANYEEMWG